MLEGTLQVIDELRCKISELERRVSESQQNLELMEDVLGAWVETPVFKRKGGTRDGLLSLEEKNDQLNAV